MKREQMDTLLQKTTDGTLTKEGVRALASAADARRFHSQVRPLSDDEKGEVLKLIQEGSRKIAVDKFGMMTVLSAISNSEG